MISQCCESAIITMWIWIRMQGFERKKIAKFYGFLYLKFQFFFFVDLHEGDPRDPSYRRSLQPSKENIQHFKTCNLFFLWFILASWMQIQPTKIKQIHPDPKHWT
jgi:hypothetical protein